jgi:hypothetical protein
MTGHQWRVCAKGLVLLGLVSVPASVEAQRPWVMWEGFAGFPEGMNASQVPADWQYWTPVEEFTTLRECQAAISASAATWKGKEVTTGESRLAVVGSQVRTWLSKDTKPVLATIRDWRCFPAGFVPGGGTVK